MDSKELKWVYGTVLSTPGMEERVKLDFRISRKVALLLSQLIDRGLEVKGSGLPEVVGEPVLHEVKEIAQAVLEKAGVQSLVDHLQKLEA